MPKMYDGHTKAAIYLGDAVYAQICDGVIELRLNDHRNDTVIYMEPEVYEALVLYVEGRSTNARIQSRHILSRLDKRATTARPPRWEVITYAFNVSLR